LKRLINHDVLHTTASSLACNTVSIQSQPDKLYILKRVPLSILGTRAVAHKYWEFGTRSSHICLMIVSPHSDHAGVQRTRYTRSLRATYRARSLPVPGDAFKNALNWRSYDALRAHPFHAAKNVTPNERKTHFRTPYSLTGYYTQHTPV
jgi:hypothetical protein